MELIALVSPEQPEVRLSFYLLPFPRYSSISGFCCKPETEETRSKKVFYLIALVPTEQPEVRLPFYQLPFKDIVPFTVFAVNRKWNHSGSLRNKILCIPQFHPPIVYVYQISELCDKFQVSSPCGGLM